MSYAYYGPDAGAFLGQAFLNNGTVISHQDLNTDSYSGFAQATWHATDRLDLTAGIRQTYERKTASVVRDQATGNPGIGAAFPAYETGNLDVSDTRPSGLVSVSYQFTDNVLAYTSVSSGAKAGGINPQVPARGLGIDSLFIEPEKAKDAELGIKTTLFDRRVQFNANAFWTNVEDYQATNLEQITPGVFSQTLSNIGKVETRGFEVELVAIPLEGLTVGLTGSFNDATYESYKNAPCSAEKSFAGQTVCDLTGNPVVGAPRWIANPSVGVRALDRQRPHGVRGVGLRVAIGVLRLAGQLRSREGRRVRHPQSARRCQWRVRFQRVGRHAVGHQRARRSVRGRWAGCGQLRLVLRVPRLAARVWRDVPRERALTRAPSRE